MIKSGIPAPVLGRNKYNRVVFDDFEVAAAAGSVDATLSDGPGVRKVTDTESKISVSGGRLVFAGGQTVPADGDPAYWLGANNAGAIGAVTLGDMYAAVYDITPSATNKTINLGIDSGTSGLPSEPYIELSSGGNIEINTYTNDAIVKAYTATNMKLVQLCGNRRYIFGLLNTDTNKIEVLWVDVTTPPASGYASLMSYDGALVANRVGVVDMSSDPAFSSDTASATDYKAGSPIGNFTDGVHEPDFFLHATGTVSALTQIAVRYQDGSNAWLLFFNGGTLTLYELVAGVPTSRGAGAYPHGVALKLDVRFVGSDISIYINGARIINYTSASSFSDKTTFTCSGGTFTEFSSWPIYIDLQRKVF